jgi:hypothetical protein
LHHTISRTPAAAAPSIARGVSAEGTARLVTTADTVANAIRVTKILTGEVDEDMGDSGKDKAAQASGKKGGAARRNNLTPERRREIARKAAEKR